MDEYHILKNLIAHGGSMGYTDLLNLHKRRPLQTKGNCIALRDSGFILGDFRASTVVSVTSDGYAQYGKLCDLRRKRIVTLILKALAWIIPLLLPYFIALISRPATP